MDWILSMISSLGIVNLIMLIGIVLFGIGIYRVSKEDKVLREKNIRARQRQQAIEDKLLGEQGVTNP